MKRANRWLSFTTAATAAVVLTASTAQQTDPLLKRWVGVHLNQPLFLDFYSDTMLHVSHGAGGGRRQFAVDFWFDWDSLVVFGDTNFAVRYRGVFDKLIIETTDGFTVTLTEQDRLARPVWGVCCPPLVRWMADQGEGRRVELRIFRGGTAQWRAIPGGSWQAGEWSRIARDYLFTWETETDTTEWRGFYDAPQELADGRVGGDQFIFENIGEGTSITVFRRVIRR